MKGICFKEPLFHATIQMRKTQTRRIMNPQPDIRGPRTTNVLFEDWHGKEIRPKYRVGEVVYLKEPYLDDLSMEKTFYKYRKSDVQELMKQYPEMEKDTPGFWRNKLFMPEPQARYFINITDVRTQQLQEITDEDCMKEGIEAFTKDERVFKYGLEGWGWSEMPRSPIEAYAALIDQINGKGTWTSNPWVFVYGYELMPFKK